MYKTYGDVAIEVLKNNNLNCIGYGDYHLLIEIYNKTGRPNVKDDVKFQRVLNGLESDNRFSKAYFRGFSKRLWRNFILESDKKYKSKPKIKPNETLDLIK